MYKLKVNHILILPDIGYRISKAPLPVGYGYQTLDMLLVIVYIFLYNTISINYRHFDTSLKHLKCIEI